MTFWFSLGRTRHAAAQSVNRVVPSALVFDQAAQRAERAAVIVNEPAILGMDAVVPKPAPVQSLAGSHHRPGAYHRDRN